jgi:site-specific recombinase XerD
LIKQVNKMQEIPNNEMAITFSAERINELISLFLEESKYANNTKITYRKALAFYEKYYIKRMPVYDQQLAEKYRVYLEKIKKFEKYTVRTYLTAASKFSAFLLNKSEISFNPFSNITFSIKKPKNEFAFFDKKQIKFLFDYIEKKSNYKERDLCLLALILYCRLAEEEIIELTIGDLQNYKKKLFINKPKSARSAHLNLEVPKEAHQYLEDYVNVYLKSLGLVLPSDYLFRSVSKNGDQSHLTRRGIRDILLRLIADSKISQKVEYRVKPIHFRHTAMILYLNQGANPEELSTKYNIKSKSTLKQYLSNVEIKQVKKEKKIEQEVKKLEELTLF